MKTLNIYSTVRIKLTPYGIAVLRGQHAKTRLLFPSCGKFTPPKSDKDGYCEMKLLEIITTFGRDIYEGCTLPFEPNIQIDEEQLKES